MPLYKTKNEHFFKTWSPAMAYVLGFFAADGNMHINKRGACYIEFQSNDLGLLKSIRKTLSSNHKFTVRRRKHINHHTSYRLQIGSKSIYYDLLKLGMLPNKSNVLQLPYVPDIYFHHFVRGYFDGDGCVVSGIYKRSDRNTKKHLIISSFISGSKQILLSLHEKLEELSNVSGGLVYFHRGFRLQFAKKNSFALYNFMYTDAEIYLPRKRQIFEKYFKIR